MFNRFFDDLLPIFSIVVCLLHSLNCIIRKKSHVSSTCESTAKRTASLCPVSWGAQWFPGIILLVSICMFLLLFTFTTFFVHE